VKNDKQMFGKFVNEAIKRFNLKRTKFIYSRRGVIPEVGWLGTVDVKNKKVYAVAPANRETVLHEGVHAFFREMELEKGYPPLELTDFDLEEITAYVVSRNITNSFRICSDKEVKYIDEIVEEYHPYMQKEVRLLEAFELGCVHPKDKEFVEKVKGENPKEVYNKIAKLLGYEPINTH